MSHIIVMEVGFDGMHPDGIEEKDVISFVSESLDSAGVSVIITDVIKKEDE